MCVNLLLLNNNEKIAKYMLISILWRWCVTPEIIFLISTINVSRISETWRRIVLLVQSLSNICA